MKTFCLCLFVLPFFFSCSPDNGSSLPDAANAPSRRAGTPSNPDNLYDEVGEIHNRLLAQCGGTLPSTSLGIIALVEGIADSDPDYAALKSSPHTRLSASHMDALLGCQGSCLDDALDATGMGSRAKGSLGGFVSSFIPYCDAQSSYDSIYDFVTDYEDTVINDPLLSGAEKKRILIATSIARHSAHFKKKPKKNTDPDWNIMVTHMTGAIEGTGHGTSEAITRSLALGLAENN